jgi:hypothetical protein
MVRGIEILNPAAEIPDGPSDCQLLVALPLDREDFLRQLREGPEGNFANAFRVSGRSKLADQAVYLVYGKYAELAKDVIADVRRRGVSVIENARLSDFVAATRTSRVTTLVAHSRDARFEESDIAEPELILAELRKPGSALRKAVKDPGREPEEEPGLMATRKEVANCLNRVLEGATPAPDPDHTRIGMLTRQHLGWSHKRKALEDALPKAFRGGAGIEFSEGFVKLAAILDAIPEHFSGKLDLTSCNSTVFAEDVRRKCKSCLLMANEQATSVDLRFAIYRQVIRRLCRKAQTYEDALFTVRKELL